jgi:phosphatidate cytidylyltransferase
MKNILERLLVFLIGVPAILAVIFFLPQKNHLVLNVGVIVFCVLGALEFSSILKKKNLNLRTAEAIVLGGLSPLTMTLYVSFGWTPFLVAASALVCASYCLIRCAFTPTGKLDEACPHLVAGFSLVFYPGLLLGCIILMSGLSNQAGAQTTILASYLCMVLVNDGAAWLFGMLFGKGNKGIVAASPNKSIAGFIAGVGASVIVGIAASLWAPEVFEAAYFPATASGILLGFTTGIASIIGDLAESAIKRSSGVKDSGGLMPGRGGILDSVDSLSLAAPVFFIIYNALFNIRV